MKGLIEYIKTASFHLRWLFMSAEERYNYLWGKTKKLDDSGYGMRRVVIIPTNSRR
jgi:hypothetical protein